MRRIKIFSLSFLFFILASCSLFKDFEPGAGAVRVKLPGPVQGRAIKTTDYVQSDAFFYDVIIQGEGYSKTEESVPGSQVLFTEIPAGDYSVTVNAFKDSGREVKVATETTTVTVVGNETANARIIMRPLSYFNNLSSFTIEGLTFIDGKLAPGATLIEYYPDDTTESGSFDLYKEYFEIDTAAMNQIVGGDNLLVVGSIPVLVTYLPQNDQVNECSVISKYSYKEPVFELTKALTDGKTEYIYKMTNNRFVFQDDETVPYSFNWEFFDDEGIIIEDYDGFDLDMDGKSYSAVATVDFYNDEIKEYCVESDLSEKKYEYSGTVEFITTEVSTFDELKSALTGDGAASKILIKNDIEMTGTITVPSGKTIQLSASDEKVTLTPKNAGSYPFMSFSGVTATLKNIDFDNNFLTAQESFIKVESGSDVSLSNCDFKNYHTVQSTSCAINITTSNLSLKNCNFVGGEDGSWTSPGIITSSAVNANIENCEFKNIKGSAIKLNTFGSDSDNIIFDIKNSTFDSCGNAIKASGKDSTYSKTINLSNCTIKNCSGNSDSINALSFEGGSNAASSIFYVTLDGCEIYDNWGDLQGGDGAVRVSGNVVLNLNGTQKQTVIKNNFYPVAGALYVSGSTVNINNALISGNGTKNEKISDGYDPFNSTGGIFVNSGSVQIKYPSEIKNNTCSGDAEKNGQNAFLKAVGSISYLDGYGAETFAQELAVEGDSVAINNSIPE